MHVVVLGRSLPGMMAALEMAHRGNKVTLIGLADARSLTALGAQYLWDTAGIREYMTRCLDIPKESIYDSSDVRHVKFAEGLFCGDPKYTLTYPTDSQVNRYKKKVGSKHPPCAGKYDIPIIDDGFMMLHKALNHQLQLRKIEILTAKVNNIDPQVGTLLTVAEDGSEKWIDFDGLINTIDRVVFENACGATMKKTTREVFFATSSKNWYGRFQNSPNIWTNIIYDSNPWNPWHRMTVSPEGLYVYEAFSDCKGLPWDTIHCMTAKTAERKDLIARPGVIHLGRWAEMEPELLVSDIPSRLEFLTFDF